MNIVPITEQNILAVVRGVETSNHVLEAAIECAQQEFASLLVVYVMPLRRYEASQQSLANSQDLKHEGYTFSHTQAVEEAKSVATRAAETLIGERDIPFTALGEVGKFVRPYSTSRPTTTVSVSSCRRPNPGLDALSAEPIPGSQASSTGPSSASLDFPRHPWTRLSCILHSAFFPT